MDGNSLLILWGNVWKTLRGSGMATPRGGVNVWQSLWRGGVTLPGGSGGEGSEWYYLERDPQDKEHCHPCHPQVLWTMGSTEVRASTSESPCRAPIGHSREGLAMGFQWPRDLNVSCVWYEQPVSPASETETVQLLVGAILSPGSPSGIGINKNPKTLGGIWSTPGVRWKWGHGKRI